MPFTATIPSPADPVPPRVPDSTGFADQGGVRLAYQIYENPGRPSIVLVPTWSIVPARFWKAQVPYLARHFRVITFDGRGAGASDRPAGAAAYQDQQYADDIVAVLDAAGADRAVLVALSCGVTWSLWVAAEHPGRVTGLVAIAPSCGFDVPQPDRDAFPWQQRLDSVDGWATYNRHYWLKGDYDGFLQFFFGQMFSEPHSTKQIEDGVAWGHQIEPATLVDTTAGRLGCDGAMCEPVETICPQIRCEVLVVHGTDDRIRTSKIGERLAELTQGSLVLIEGGGHGIPARDPVRTNLLIAEFAERVSGVQPQHSTRRVRDARSHRKALYLSSPIGLGHARRDVAIARELRTLHPDLQIDWLAQHPVTRVLTDARERVHPASALLAGESAHIEHEAGEHDLNAFAAIRRMDEILVANFMVFSEVIQEGQYDLVIGDEAWDVDYFLHENPGLKRFAFAWMTDFVGWLPMPDGGAREAMLTADYNAEMIEQRARHQHIRDRSVFVGDPEDVVDECFGPGLPNIRSWTTGNFDFTGYVTGFEPPDDAVRSQVRRRLGYSTDDLLCVVTVGGSGVGASLLQRILQAVPVARRLDPSLKFLFVTGPRIDPKSLTRTSGVRIRGYVPDLHRLLGVADLAIVQGGLTTCMELTACGTPFIYVPLRHHFEQNLHVRHRLDRHRAGRHLSYEEAADPDLLAAAIAAEVRHKVDYLPVPTDGAARAAGLLGELI
jgi:pimeloyl-ACP methyl ester carboxylesterase/predicted glycosyltransferase